MVFKERAKSLVRKEQEGWMREQLRGKSQEAVSFLSLLQCTTHLALELHSGGSGGSGGSRGGTRPRLAGCAQCTRCAVE